MTDATVDRLHQALVEELRSRGHAGEPITVGRLHREIVPYGAVRSALGVALAADYEDALLRLLAGEKGLLRLEPANARAELRRELDAPDPAPDLLRRLADAEVYITLPDSAERPAQAHAGEPDEEPDEEPDGPGPEPDQAADVRLHPAAAEPAGAGPTLRLHQHARAGAPAPADCSACGAELPEDREVRFCPYCGHDQRVRRCTHCDAILEAEWRFCTRCGTEASGD